MSEHEIPPQKAAQNIPEAALCCYHSITAAAPAAPASPVTTVVFPLARDACERIGRQDGGSEDEQRGWGGRGGRVDRHQGQAEQHTGEFPGIRFGHEKRHPHKEREGRAPDRAADSGAHSIREDSQPRDQEEGGDEQERANGRSSRATLENDKFACVLAGVGIKYVRFAVLKHYVVLTLL